MEPVAVPDSALYWAIQHWGAAGASVLNGFKLRAFGGQLCHLPLVRPWASYLTSSCLSFVFVKPGSRGYNNTLLVRGIVKI